MNHYQKLATLVIRLIALTVGVIGAIAFVSITIQEIQFNAQYHTRVAHSNLVAIFYYLVPSVIVYLLAPAIGRMVGKDMAE